MKCSENRLRQRHALLFSVAAAAIAVSVGPRLSQAEEGLRGVLRFEVPAGLYEEDFLELGDSWESWSTGVSEEVTKFYEADDLNLESQKASLAVLRKKLGTMEKALADRRYRSIYEPLVRMHTRLNRRVTLAEAIVATLEVNPATAHDARVGAARVAVVDAVDNLDEWLTKDIRNGRPWLKFVKADQVRAISGGSVSMDVLSAVYTKLADVDAVENEAQREFIKRPRFVQLKASLDSYIALARTEAPVVNQAELRETLATLVDSVESWEDDQTSESAAAVRSAFLKVRKQAGDEGAAIGEALASHYFNYNLRIVASEKFLNKVAGYEYTDAGPVKDFILGADVTGNQTTTATVGIDLTPSKDSIAFYMTVRGITQTRTIGVTDQATVNTSGYHTFYATKAIRFDGDKFGTAPAKISVNANNTTTGVRTKYSSILLFGSIADSIAKGEVAERKARSEAIARDRVSTRVLPEFNSEVEAEFKKHSDALKNDINPKLHDAKMFPTARSFTTSDTELWANTRQMSETELGGDDPTFSTTSSKGIAIHLHESVINNSLSLLPLGGRTLNEEELVTEISAALKQLLGKDINLKKGEGEESDPTQFVFPEKDFMRVRLDSGVLTLLLQAGLKTDDETIPTQLISVPLTFAIEGSDLVLEAGDVSVAPVERPKSAIVQIARAGIVRTKIQKALPTRKIDRKFDLKRGQGGPVDLAITQVRPNAGWLSIVIE
jgi:hypothetical protein